MKHLKPLNQKAHQVEKAAEAGELDEVVAMQTVVGCAATTDPGWDAVSTHLPRTSLPS